MNLFDCGNKLSVQQLDNFEKKIRQKLPADYRNFMIEHNGGTPSEDLVFDYIDVVVEQENTTDIREFYIFYDSETNNYDDIVYIYKTMTNDKIIPPEMLPIGDDSLGNPFGILLSKGNDYGKIYLMNHEIENSETGYLAMSKVADSFADFITKIYIDI